jgi:hypothetical protein
MRLHRNTYDSDPYLRACNFLQCQRIPAQARLSLSQCFAR